MSIATKTSDRWFTAEDLERLPPDFRCELIRGELRKMPPPPGDAHGSTTNRLAYYLSARVYENDLGECYAAETGFRIHRNPDTIVAPDFAFVARERLTEGMQAGYLALVPDLVLETRSPSDSRKHVQEKVSLWLEAGARMVLELDPRARVLTVYRPGEEPQTLSVEDTLDGGDVLPGLALPVRKLFRDL